MRKIGLIAGLLLMYAHTVFASAFYLGGHGGLLVVDESRNESAQGRFNLKFDPGTHTGVVLGFDLADSYPNIGTGRMELEASLRQSDAERITFSEGPLPATGKVRVESLLLNTFGEYRESAPWLPYFGVGAGVARVRMENVSVLGETIVDDEDTVFAWQVGAGLGLQAFRHLAFDLGYRYFQAHQPKFTDSEGVESRARYRAHSVLLGARLMF
jgi:opacity protein-like surface antigen